MANIIPSVDLSSPNNYDAASATLTIPAADTTDTDGVDLRGYLVRTIAVTCAGSSGSISYVVEGSVDGTNWAPIAVRANAGGTYSTGTITQSSATTAFRHLDPQSYVRFVRVAPSANTLNDVCTVNVAAER